MNEHKAVPNIRFNGFEDEWRRITISEVGLVATGNTPSTKQARYYSKKGVPWITPSNIEKDGKVYNVRYLSNEGEKIGRIVPKGSVLVTSIASIGKNTLLKEDSAFNQQINAITPNKKYNSYFLYTACNQVSKKMKDIASAGTMQIVNKKEFSRMLIICPLLLEQEKIGNFFAKLDKLLDLQQQKIDKLELLKKALLQKLFPKYGAKIPELRFKGCDGEWEEKKFSSLYKKSNEKNNLSFGNNKIISVANMYYKKDNVKSDDNYMRTYNIFRLGDIAFEGHKSKKFTFGRFVENTIGDGIVSHVFEVFKPISNGDITYWKYAIHNEDFIARILMKSTVKATMMNNLIAKDFLKQRVPVPQLSEQQKIGNLLSKVDQLIELENKKLQNLQQVKKCLLQNMFVE